jgi:hypothetical protein
VGRRNLVRTPPRDGGHGRAREAVWRNGGARRRTGRSRPIGSDPGHRRRSPLTKPCSERQNLHAGRVAERADRHLIVWSCSGRQLAVRTPDAQGSRRATADFTRAPRHRGTPPRQVCRPRRVPRPNLTRDDRPASVLGHVRPSRDASQVGLRFGRALRYEQCLARA